MPDEYRHADRTEAARGADSPAERTYEGVRPRLHPCVPEEAHAEEVIYSTTPPGSSCCLAFFDDSKSPERAS